MGMFNKPEGQQDNKPKQQMDYDKSDPFSKVGNAEGREGGVYPEPGLYPILYVDTLKMIRSRKNDDLFIAEFDIVASEVDARPVGTRMSWVANLTKHDAAPGNVKTFLAKLMNVPDQEVDANGAKFACSDENPCHGRLVRLEASIIQTKSGGDFTLCKWFTLDKEMQDQADEIRKQAGFAPF